MNIPLYDVSIIVPIFNEEESLSELHDCIKKVMIKEGFSYEIIMVDDGSTDTSWQIIQQLAADNPCIKGVCFNRNYGKSAALSTGFNICKGKVVITLDADLQDNPEEIPSMVSMVIEEKLDLVSGWKRTRYDPLSKILPSKLFNLVTRNISGIKLNDFNCGLKAYNHHVIKNINVYGEMHRYIPLIAKWNGFDKIGEKVVQHQYRKYGKTKFGFERFIFGFLDLLSITFVFRFRKSPMHFFGTLGVISFLFGISIAFGLILEKLYNIYYKLEARDVTDQPLFFLGLIAAIIGSQLFLAGFLAEIMATNNQRKNDYIIKEKTFD